MHAQHREILKKIQKQERKGTSHSDNDSYIRSGHQYYDVSVPTRRAIAKDWLRANKNISKKEFLAVLDSLYKGDSHEEKTIASQLLGYSREIREGISLKKLESWLDQLVGWAEIDSLCQNNFTADEMLGRWSEWETLIRKLAKSKNINKRRAALVLLTGPVQYSPDKRIANLSFEILDALKHEKDILITKAVSWLLRSVVTNHKPEVSQYIEENKDTLPKVALRETIRKIRTGKK